MALEFLHIVKTQASKLLYSQFSYPFTIVIDDPKKNDADENDANKKFKNNFVLKEAIEVALSKMIKDKKDEPNKKIPHGFEEFANSQMYKDLLEAMLDYNRVSTIRNNYH